MKFAMLTCLFFAVAAAGQTARPAGVTSEWDMRKLLASLDLQAQHLHPVIAQVTPENWLANGAPETYVIQWKTAQAELQYLLSSSETFARQPEKLTLALDTYFRMQALESTLGSVMEGVRKYQNPALADLMAAVLGENSVNRDHLRQYIADLATQKEQEWQVADREAQRCREALVQPPAGSKERKPVRK
jgi:hypothetical protein